jgi:hypothetical protein
MASAYQKQQISPTERKFLIGENKEASIYGQNDVKIKEEMPKDDPMPMDIDSALDGEKEPLTASSGAVSHDIDVDAAMDDDDDDDTQMESWEFANNHRKFTTDIEKLEAENSTYPKDREAILSEIVQLEAHIEILEQAPPPLPTPKLEVTDHVSADEAARTTSQHNGPTIEQVTALQDIHANRAKTPPISSLPYLKLGPQTFTLPIEPAKLSAQARVLSRVIEERRQRQFQKEEALRQEYRAKYEIWARDVDRMEAERRQSEPSIDEPISDTKMADVEPQPTGRRQARQNFVNSDYQLEQILRESAQQAEEEKKEREAKARKDTTPDPLREAKVPDMILDENELRVSCFKDKNYCIKGGLQIETAFAYIPPKDDFTAPEHEGFCENWALYPKKWSKLALVIPPRMYKECIQHYYLTKLGKNAKGEDISVYKAILSKKRPKGRSRKKVIPDAGKKPGSNALMSNLGIHGDTFDGEEFDQPVIPVTDSGRPRRAAAPTFGAVEAATNNGDSEGNAQGRKGAGRSNDNRQSETNDAAEGKPAKRLKTGEKKEKGQRKAKNQSIAAAPNTTDGTPNPSPQKPVKERAKTREPKPVKAGVEERTAPGIAMESNDPPAGFSQIPKQGPVPATAPPQFDRQPQFDGSADDGPGARAPSLAPNNNTPEPGQPFNPRIQGQQPPRDTAQTSSYWSVPEANDFPVLLDCFGNDWTAIANHMGTKTHVMVSACSNLLSLLIDIQ